ncbi:FHA domain-containing protein [Scytonema sp. NUACC26]|uniref:FHA domain-containing protein n=1 Tax=Scytonema sp. NUACC26 TaxID=3140176 RepID=UPI0034DCA159
MMKVRVLNAETLDKINEVNLNLIPNENNEYIIGRSSKSGLVLDSLDVSRQHGKFFLRDGNYYYSDLGSINGSLVNDKLVETDQVYALKSGDVVRIGEFLLVMEETNKNNEEPEALPVTVLNMDWQAAMAAIKDRVVKPENEALKVMAQDPEEIHEVAEPVFSHGSQSLIKESEESTFIQPTEEAEVSERNTETVINEDKEAIQAVNAQQIFNEDDNNISQPVSQDSEDETPVAQISAEIPEVIDEEDRKDDEQQQEEAIPTVDAQLPLAEDELDEDEGDDNLISQPVSQDSEDETPVAQISTETPEVVDEEDRKDDEQQQEEVIPTVDAQLPLTEDELDEDEDDDNIISQPVSQDSEDETPVAQISTETPEVVDEEDRKDDEQQQEEVIPTVDAQLPLTEDELDEDEGEDNLISRPASHNLEIINEEEYENLVSAVNTQLTLDENAVSEETNIETQEVDDFDAIANTVEEAEKLSNEDEVDNSQTTLDPDIEDASEEDSETSNQTPQLPKQALEILSKKYIALMAHDTKKSDLVDFVTQHKDFLFRCLTISTPSISETLFLKTGFATSQKTASVPAGGHQSIAALVGSGDILAVILLKDILPIQSQANEDALLRLCNANQVLVATNLPTAEAVLLYIKNMVNAV